MPTRFNFLDTTLLVSDREEVLSRIDSASSKNRVSVATANPEFMLESRRNPQFKSALENSSLCTIDGSGLLFFLSLWSKITGHNKPSLYHGADLVSDLFEAYKSGNRSFYFLGGPPGLSKKAKIEILKLYPHLAIVGESDGGILDKKNVLLSTKLKTELSTLKPDIVLVGFGAPKQELWIAQAAQELSVPVMIGVGGTLGFYTEKRRAPEWIRTIHMEWLDRSFHEAGHWKRAWNAVVVFSLTSLIWIVRNSHKAKKA